MKTWRCFHCDEVLRTPVDARNHFGNTHGSEAACLIKAPGEFAMLQALRNAEDELARYRSEDSDVLRAMWSAQSDHAAALRREEEKGYARGLEDAKAHPETLGLRSAGETNAPPRDVQTILDASKAIDSAAESRGEKEWGLDPWRMGFIAAANLLDQEDGRGAAAVRKFAAEYRAAQSEEASR
jgi:hypothetical protein